MSKKKLERYTKYYTALKVIPVRGAPLRYIHLKSAHQPKEEPRWQLELEIEPGCFHELGFYTAVKHTFQFMNVKDHKRLAKLIQPVFKKTCETALSQLLDCLWRFPHKYNVEPMRDGVYRELQMFRCTAEMLGVHRKWFWECSITGKIHLTKLGERIARRRFGPRPIAGKAVRNVA